MSTKVKPIPDGFHSITPYMTVKGAAAAIDFYKRAFGAIERGRFCTPDGSAIGHAEIIIGNSIIMLCDEMPMCGNKSPQTLGGSPMALLIYVENVDAAFKRAVDAGAKVEQPLEDRFYGERAGCVSDPFGHMWTLMTHIEDVSFEEIKTRMAAFYEKMKSSSQK